MAIELRQISVHRWRLTGCCSIHAASSWARATAIAKQRWTLFGRVRRGGPMRRSPALRGQCSVIDPQFQNILKSQSSASFSQTWFDQRRRIFSKPLEWSGWLLRSEEHTSELQSLMRISYAVFCLKKKKQQKNINKLNIESKQLQTKK